RFRWISLACGSLRSWIQWTERPPNKTVQRTNGALRLRLCAGRLTRRPRLSVEPLVRQARLGAFLQGESLNCDCGGENRTSQLKRTQGSMQTAGETAISKA